MVQQCRLRIWVGPRFATGSVLLERTYPCLRVPIAGEIVNCDANAEYMAEVETVKWEVDGSATVRCVLTDYEFAREAEPDSIDGVAGALVESGWSAHAC